MAQYLFEGFDPTLRERLVDGTILVVGANFGIGSSREHVPLAMKGSGIRGVVGRSFARIFYRNCVNLGLAIVACPEAVDAAHDGSRVAIDTAGAVEVDGVAFDAPPAPPLVLELGAAGGLVDWTASRLAARRGAPSCVVLGIRLPAEARAFRAVARRARGVRRQVQDSSDRRHRLARRRLESVHDTLGRNMCTVRARAGGEGPRRAGPRRYQRSAGGSC